MHGACQRLVVLAFAGLVGCGSGIKPISPGPDDSGGSTEDGDPDGGEGTDGDGSADGEDGGDDGGSGGEDGGRVEVELSVEWVTRLGPTEVCAGTLIEENVPESWAEWGVWTDIDPELAEPRSRPASRPDPGQCARGAGHERGPRQLALLAGRHL